jgi:imidazole glycerol phosphate synthase subunit HisF
MHELSRVPVIASGGPAQWRTSHRPSRRAPTPVLAASVFHNGEITIAR